MITKKPSLTIALVLSAVSLLVGVKPAAADVSIEIISRSDFTSPPTEAHGHGSSSPQPVDAANQEQDGSRLRLNASKDNEQGESQTIDDDFEGILIRI
jgi:hypothetical protein